MRSWVAPIPGAKDLEPQELVKELSAVLDKGYADGDQMWSSEAGEVLSSLFEFRFTNPLDQREDIWNAIQQLTKVGIGSPHFTAMLYGYDGVDHESNKLGVWFNRGALAAVDGPMSVSEMKEVVGMRKAA